jgi:predicted branched-subunit amino acid permease
VLAKSYSRKRPVVSLSATTLPAQEIKRGLITALPVMLSFIPFSLVLGAQAIQKGMSTGQISLLTAVNFAGGSEFVAVNLWTSPPHLFLIALMILLVNSRHILMSAALTPYLKDLPKRKVLPALFFMCDESWALAFTDAKKLTCAEIQLLLLSWYKFWPVSGLDRFYYNRRTYRPNNWRYYPLRL